MNEKTTPTPEAQDSGDINQLIEVFEDSLSRLDLTPGAIIKGTIVDIKPDYVVVDAGLKSESVIPLYEFEGDQVDGEPQVLAIGQECDLYLEAIENGFGETCLSREKAKKAVEWLAIEQAYENGESIKAVISERVKGGFTIHSGTVRGFLPGSQVDIRPTAKNQDSLVGSEMEFKIVKVDKKRNNIVVSRRSMLEGQDNEERAKLLDSLSVGSVIKGVVKNLTDYGAFVDLGGIDGLLHITDMSWKRIKNPSDVLTMGEEIEVKVLSYDKEKRRVSLGLKQLHDDPWEDLSEKYPLGSRVYGKVTNITEYGSFVEIGNTIEGLVHMSEMDWTNKNVNPSKVVQVGDEIEVMVLDIDRAKRRISLGLKQCMLNPWQEFFNNHEKGEVIKGKVKTVTDFGVFIGLEGGIDGLIHATDLSWTESGENLIRQMKKGEEVSASILSIDPERERVSLGVKQLATDPFAEFFELNQRHSKIQVTLLSRESNGALVKVNEKIRGIIKLSEISKDLEEGATIDAYITMQEARNYLLPLTTVAPKKEDLVDVHHKANISSRVEPQRMTSLGSLIKDKLSSEGDENK